MLTFVKKHFVFTLLLTAFISRIAIGVFADMKYVQVFSKYALNDKSEKEDSAEEKIKIPDAVIPATHSFVFSFDRVTKSNIFAHTCNLLVCHLPVKIQPPKTLV